MSFGGKYIKYNKTLPVPKGKIYSGPAIPVVYQVDWQLFKNLTPDQVAWYRAQPEWANFLDYVALSPSTASVATPAVVVDAALRAAGKTPRPHP